MQGRVNVFGLGYLGITTTDLSLWDGFATDILGMARSGEVGGEVRYRMDVRNYRLALSEGQPGLSYVGWEVRSRRDLDEVERALTDAGVTVKDEGEEAAQNRGVVGLRKCQDPAGNNLEFFWGAGVDETKPFESPWGVRFLTGNQGMGHIVLATTRYAEMVDFYGGTLGFYFSDVMTGHPNVSFLGCNERHHSIAIVEAPVEAMHHFMVEVEELDMVGCAYDRVLDQRIDIVMTLGRHWNDHMMSFYAQTPSGFAVEFGWGARRIDRATWSTVRGSGDVSFWGHRPMTEEMREVQPH